MQTRSRINPKGAGVFPKSRTQLAAQRALDHYGVKKDKKVLDVSLCDLREAPGTRKQGESE